MWIPDTEVRALRDIDTDNITLATISKEVENFESVELAQKEVGRERLFSGVKLIVGAAGSLAGTVILAGEALNGVAIGRIDNERAAGAILCIAYSYRVFMENTRNFAKANKKFEVLRRLDNYPAP